MDWETLKQHLASAEHGHDVVVEVVTVGEGSGISADESYLRGFHDGCHGRIDADDLDLPGHRVTASR